MFLVTRRDEARQWHLGDYLSPVAWLAADGAVAAQQRDALVHAEQSDAFTRARAIPVPSTTSADRSYWLESATWRSASLA